MNGMPSDVSRARACSRRTRVDLVVKASTTEMAARSAASRSTTPANVNGDGAAIADQSSSIAASTSTASICASDVARSSRAKPPAVMRLRYLLAAERVDVDRMALDQRPQVLAVHPGLARRGREVAVVPV